VETKFLNAGSFFSSAPSTSALSQRSTATAGTFGDRHGAQDSNKRNTLYILHKLIIQNMSTAIMKIAITELEWAEENRAFLVKTAVSS